MCQWRNTRPKSMLPHWIRSNSTTRDWGMLYKTYTHIYHLYIYHIFMLWFGIALDHNLNQGDLQFNRAWLPTPSRASTWLAGRNTVGMFYDWLRTHTAGAAVIGWECPACHQRWCSASVQLLHSVTSHPIGLLPARAPWWLARRG